MIFRFLAIFIFSISYACLSEAATYYVDSTAGACTGNYSIANRNCSGSDGNSYATIGAAENAATSAGDIVYIRAGTYTETVTCGYSGSEGGGYITFAAYPGEEALSTPWIVRGSNQVILQGRFNLSNRSYIRIIGLEITNTDEINQSMFLLSTADHIQILNNYLHHNEDQRAMISAHNYPSNYITIRGNVLYYSGCFEDGTTSCTGNSLGIGAGGVSETSTHHWLIEYNKLHRMGDFINLHGSTNVIRNNWLSDHEPTYWTSSMEWSSSSSVAIGSGSKVFQVGTGLTYVNGCVFYIYYDANNGFGVPNGNSSYNSLTGELTVTPTYYNGSGTYSSWTIKGWGIHPDGFQPVGGAADDFVDNVYESNIVGSFEATAFPGTNNSHIWNIRQTSGDDDPNRFIFRKNIAYKIGGGNTMTGLDEAYIYGNVFYRMLNKSVGSGTIFNQSGEGGAYPAENARFVNNIFHSSDYDNLGTASIVGYAYGASGTDTNNIVYNCDNTSSLSGTVSTSDPSLTDPENMDYSIQVGSAARDYGVSLTLANGSGSNTTALVVDDSNYFTDGYGIVEGDKIIIGSGSAVRIASINSATSITLAEARTWSDDDPVILASMLDSSTPDVGALPYRSGGYTVSGTYVLSGTTLTVTPNDNDLVRGVVVYEDNIPQAPDYDSPFVFTVGTGTLRVEILKLYADTTPIVLASDGSAITMRGITATGVRINQ